MEEKSRVYIMTLGVLAPYRNRGVGRELLEGILEHVDTQMSSVTSIYLHVWVENKEARKWSEMTRRAHSSEFGDGHGTSDRSIIRPVLSIAKCSAASIITRNSSVP